MGGRNAPFRILANLYAAQKASREMTGGVLHYAAVHPEVELRLYGVGAPLRHFAELRGWRPEGVIVTTDDPAEIRRIERAGCRAAVFVNVDPPARTSLRCGSVFCDADAVADAAVGLFVRKKLRHAAYVGTRDRDAWSVARGEAVRRRAAEAGLSFASFEAPREAASDPSAEAAALARWAAGLPKPCGVFAANDLRAKDAIDACHAAGIAIPLQAMVLGADDEEFICGQLQPTLSSVVPDFGRGGYLAAETLVELLRGRRARIGRRVFGVRGIAERLSTSDPNEAGRMAARAGAFVRAYATTAGISVGDVAKASGASVRLLQKNFRAATGTTVREAIQTVRLERACELLTRTVTPIGRIGELCGFADEAHLKKLFRRRFGCTMRDWRRGARNAPRE